MNILKKAVFCAATIILAFAVINDSQAAATPLVVSSTPAAPVLSSPSNGAGNQPTSLTLSWAVSSGATSYAVQVATVSSFATTTLNQSGVTVTWAALGSLSTSMAYYWKAAATNSSGTSAWSTVSSFTTVPAAPIAPTLASPSNGATNQPLALTLNWGSVSGAASYAVQVATVSSFATTTLNQSGVTATSAALGSLSTSTTYYWKVSATNAGGTSAWSTVSNFNTVPAAPIAPTLTSPSTGAINQPLALSVTWGSVTGATSYTVQVSTAANFATTTLSQSGMTATSAALSSLSTSTTYYWKVSAANAGGTSAWSTVSNFITVPAAPIAPTLTSPSTGAINQPLALSVTWGSVTGATSYTVQVSTAANFATTMLSQSGVTATSAALSSLSTSTTYYWEVSATNPGGTSSWSTVSNFITVPAAPIAPTLTSPSTGAIDQPLALSVTWGSVTGATSYTVQVSTAANFATTTLSQSGMTATSAALSSLSTSTTYYWEVSATNPGGTSAWSTVSNFITVPAAPVAPTLTSPSTGAINQPLALSVTWGSVTGATSYTVQVSTAVNFATTTLSQSGVTAISMALSSLSTSTTYYWEVNATNAGGTSAWSTVSNFITVPPAPTVPILAAPSAGAINQPLALYITWDSVTGATSYAVQVSTASSFATTTLSQGGVTATSAALSGLATSATYYWQVNATNAGGTSAWSIVSSFITVPPAPNIPTLAAPFPGATNQALALTLDWGSVIGAISYTVQVSTAANFATTTLSQSGMTATSAALASLSTSTTYYWEANATNAGGTGAWSSVWSFTTVPPPPGVPILSAPINGASGQPVLLTLSWTPVSGATSYSFQVAVESNFSTIFDSVSGLTSTSHYVSGLSDLTTYYWRVNATNPGGTSAWAGTWTFTVTVTSVSSAEKLNLKPSFSVQNGVVAYTLNRQNPVEIRIFDMLGKKVFEFNRLQSPGSYSLSVKRLNLSSGRYILHFKAGNMERRILVAGM